MLALAAVLLAAQTGAGHYVNLKNGDRVRLLGVVDRRRQISWNASGKRSKVLEPTFVSVLGNKTVQPNPANILSLVFQIDRAARREGPDTAFRLSRGAGVIRSDYTMPEPTFGGDIWLTSVSEAFGSSGETNVWVGVAEGRWKTAAAANYVSKKFKIRQGSLFATGARQEPKRLIPVHQESGKQDMTPDRAKFSVDVRLPPGIERSAYTVRALDSTGKAFESSGSILDSGTHLPRSCWFVGRLSDLARVELQTRPYEWVKISGVRVRPH